MRHAAAVFDLSVLLSHVQICLCHDVCMAGSRAFRYVIEQNAQRYLEADSKAGKSKFWIHRLAHCTACDGDKSHQNTSITFCTTQKRSGDHQRDLRSIEPRKPTIPEILSDITRLERTFEFSSSRQGEFEFDVMFLVGAGFAAKGTFVHFV